MSTACAVSVVKSLPAPLEPLQELVEFLVDSWLVNKIVFGEYN